MSKLPSIAELKAQVIAALPEILEAPSANLTEARSTDPGHEPKFKVGDEVHKREWYGNDIRTAHGVVHRTTPTKAVVKWHRDPMEQGNPIRESEHRQTDGTRVGSTNSRWGRDQFPIQKSMPFRTGDHVTRGHEYSSTQKPEHGEIVHHDFAMAHARWSDGSITKHHQHNVGSDSSGDIISDNRSERYNDKNIRHTTIDGKRATNEEAVAHKANKEKTSREIEHIRYNAHKLHDNPELREAILKHIGRPKE